MDVNAEINGSLIEACRIMTAGDIRVIVSLLTEQQAMTFVRYLDMRLEEELNENIH